jgi:ABC-2 type transport system permease protein
MSATQNIELGKDSWGSGGALLDVSGTPRVPFSRLVSVELRKLTDTRAGKWLLISIAALTAIAMVIVLLVAISQNGDITYLDFSGVASTPMGLLLPVLGIMSVTSEWGQRTNMVTFTLEPKRSRVVAAKLTTGVIVALAAVVIALAIGAVCNLVFGAFSSGGATWNMGAADVTAFGILQVVGLLTGFAFGMLIINTAAAIVLFFAYSFILPGLFFWAASVWDWFANLQPWIDFNFSQSPLLDGDLGGVHWDEFAVSGLLWFVLPLVLGVWRLLRAEVK